MVATQFVIDRGRSSATAWAKLDIARAAAVSPLRGRIVAAVESQVGYRTNPSTTYCNKFSAFWVSGAADCGNSNQCEEWCADFAARSWQKVGALVTYQYINGDLNSSSASFYEWGLAHGTWHAVGTGYAPQPGDVTAYGLNSQNLVAQHVAVVISYTQGDAGPNVINGDGDRKGFSVVEIGNNQFNGDITNAKSAGLSGYTQASASSIHDEALQSNIRCVKYRATGTIGCLQCSPIQGTSPL